MIAEKLDFLWKMESIGTSCIFSEGKHLVQLNNKHWDKCTFIKYENSRS